MPDVLREGIARRYAAMARHAEAMLRAYNVRPPLPLGEIPMLMEKNPDA